MSIHQRYNSKAADLYRLKISALSEGCEWSREESLKKIGKIANNSTSLSHSKSASALSNNSYQDGTSFDHSSTYQSKQFKDQRDNFFNNLQAANSQRPDGLKPSEGGRYAGLNKADSKQPPFISQVIIVLFRFRKYSAATTAITIRHGFRRNNVFTFFWMELIVIWCQ
jgi:ADP-ribosylation factor GTPase-activating protein 1